MDINNALIDHLSFLAKLSFEGDEQKAIQKDLNNIVEFMGTLNEVNTDNIEPLIFLSDEVNVLREDVSGHTISHEEALLNAPKKDSDYFRIPKMLDKSK